MRHISLVAIAAFCFACSGDPMVAIREELCALKPATDSPDPSMEIREKVAVVYRDAAFEYGKFGGCELDRYPGLEKSEPTYLPVERYAEKPEELGTVVLIETRRGAFLERAEVRHSLSRKTATNVFAGDVTISLIDRQTNKIARRISFTTKNVPQQVPRERLKLNKENNYEYVCEPAIEQVRENLDRLMRQ